MKTEENDIESQLIEAERQAAAARIDQPRSGEPTSERPIPEDDEIDLVDLFRQMWARRRIVWITTLITFVIGLLIAILSPEEYEASVVLMPQSGATGNRTSSSLLRQFGGLAGLGLGDIGADGTLSPTLYPEITQSTPFFLELMDEEVHFTTLDTTTTFASYFGEIDRPGLLDHLKTYTIGLPRLIINLPIKVINSFSSPSASAPAAVVPQETIVVSDTSVAAPEPIKLTGRQRSVISKIKNRITTTIEDNNTVKISAEMPDPMVAARATEMATAYLTNYILEYRTEKSQLDLEFIQQQYNEKQKRYNNTQQRLARFRDRNLNIISETAMIEQERLEAENQLALSLYENLAQQLEQARIKVQEETPVFKVLEPIQVPLSPSSPNRELIIILSLFSGLFIGLGIVFSLILYHNFKNSLTSS